LGYDCYYYGCYNYFGYFYFYDYMYFWGYGDYYGYDYFFEPDWYTNDYDFDPFAMGDSIEWNLDYGFEEETSTSGRPGQSGSMNGDFDLEQFIGTIDLPEGFELPTIDEEYYYDSGDWSYGGYSSWGGYSNSYYGGDYSWYDYYYGYGYYGGYYDYYWGYYGGYYGYYGGWDYYGYYGDYYGMDYGTMDGLGPDDLFMMIAEGADDVIAKFDELNDVIDSGMFGLMSQSEQN
jgi:hypothetical protein